MNFCHEAYTARQEAQYIAYELTDLKNHLLEFALLDSGITGNTHFYEAMLAVTNAASAVYQLRGVASNVLMRDLASSHIDLAPIKGVLDRG